MRASLRFRAHASLSVLAVALGRPGAGLAAQSGQVEVWVPRTTRAVVVDALTQRLTKDGWTPTVVSDLRARFERPTASTTNILGQRVVAQTIDRLLITFRDLGDTLRVTGALGTVTYPNTATEQTVGRDDPKAIQEVAEILAAVKQAAQNRRPASAVAPVTEVATTPLPAPSQVSQSPTEDVVYLKNGGIIHGTIVEQRPGLSILITTRDGNTTHYAMDAIDRLTKEPIGSERPAATVVVAPSHKEPALALVLSLLITGGGQGYNGEWGKAAVMFGGAVVGLDLVLSNSQCDGYYGCSSNNTARFGAVLLLCNVLWSVIDAPIAASNINKRAGIALHPALVPLQTMGAQPRLGFQLGQVVF